MRWFVLLVLVAGCGQILGIGDFHGTNSTRDGGGVGGDADRSQDAHSDAGPGEDGLGATARRTPITINLAKVSGVLSDFPTWLDLTNADIAARARDDGQDIFFTASDGTPLDYEIQTWDASAQRLRAWVRLPQLDTSTSVTIYVEYGDLSLAVAPNPSGVFRSSFAAVWHLDDSLATTAVADATGTHAGTANGLSAAAQVPAQLGGGFAFNGSSSANIAFTNPLSGSTPHTISAWVSQLPTTAFSTILVVGTPQTDGSRWFVGNYLNDATVGFSYYNDDGSAAGRDIEDAGWVLVDWVLEGANKKNHLYVNGAEIVGSPFLSTGVANTTGTAGYLGYAPEGSYGSQTAMNGTIDEVRIATVARTAAWIATEYANQSSPNTFYTVGAEETVP